MNERKLSLKAMFRCVFIHWRSVLVMAVLMAVMLTALKYALDLRKDKSESNKAVYNSLTDEQKINVDNVILLRGRINYYEKFVEESPLFKLDLSDLKILQIQYVIKSDEITLENDNIRNSLVSVYTEFMKSDEFSKQCAKVVNLKENEFRELLEFEESVNADTVVLRVYIVDGMDTEKLAAEIDKSLKAKSKDFQNIISHSLDNTISSVLTGEKSRELEGELYYVRDMIVKAKEGLVTYEKKLSNAELEYVDEQIKKNGSEDVNEGVSVSKKMVVLGFFAGAFMMFAFWAVVSIFNTKLVSEYDIEQMYGIRNFGVWTGTKNKSKFVDKLFGYDNRFDLDYTYDFVKCSMSEDNLGELIFASSCLKNDNACVKELMSRFRDITFASDVTESGVSLKALADHKKVILVEKINESSYSAIQKEVKLCGEFGIEVLGTVIVG